MKRLLAALLLLGAPMACTKENHPPEPAKADTTAASSTSPNTVVATLNGENITEQDLQNSMDEDTRTKIYEMRENALQNLIVKKLVGAEAKKVGKTEDEWLKAQVEDKNPPATEAEAKAFFEQNRDRMPPGQSFDEIKDKLVPYVTQQKRRDAAVKLVDDLRKNAKIDIKLEEPEPPVKQVEAKGPAKGPEAAPVTIVEWSDFQCPFCSRVEPTLSRIMADYAGKVRFVFRDYPLPFHDHAQKASEASHCAEDQGKYWELHDAMFAHQDKLAVDDLKKLAKDTGLDEKKFNECLDSGTKKAVVDENQKAGTAAGVSGTPAFFVNGHMLSGAQPYEKFKKVIDRELAKAGK